MEIKERGEMEIKERGKSTRSINEDQKVGEWGKITRWRNEVELCRYLYKKT